MFFPPKCFTPFCLEQVFWGVTGVVSSRVEKVQNRVVLIWLQRYRSLQCSKHRLFKFALQHTSVQHPIVNFETKWHWRTPEYVFLRRTAEEPYVIEAPVDVSRMSHAIIKGFRESGVTKYGQNCDILWQGEGRGQKSLIKEQMSRDGLLQWSLNILCIFPAYERCNNCQRQSCTALASDAQFVILWAISHHFLWHYKLRNSKIYTCSITLNGS